jgi:acetolactate synthase-1/2/3 large subunit
VGIQSEISAALDELGGAVDCRFSPPPSAQRIQSLLAAELDQGAEDSSFPLVPSRIVADTRAACGRDDIVLADTGAVKMWMARLFPTYQPNTCLVSNGLSTLAAKLAFPERRVLAVMGDGAFLMHSQEIETAVREKVPFTVLIWEDKAFGLIEWKMDLAMGRHAAVQFENPDFVAYAESFGAKGYRVSSADTLRPTLEEAMSQDVVSVVTCPVDYRANLQLTSTLGDLTGPF